jgi:D-sedoheptulose 7-phosphate isomerase
MRNQKPCTEWAEKIAAGHLEDLSAFDRAALETHLKSCAACAKALIDYEAIASRVRAVAREEPLPPLPSGLLRLRDEIAERYDADKQSKQFEPILGYFSELEQMLQAISKQHLEAVLQLLEAAYYNGHRIFIMGNGGSAATASHFALELSKNTIMPGAPRLKAISLTDHVPLITAWSNDTAYEHIFEEQLANMVEPGDVVIGISTSGNSPNVINALLLANHTLAVTIGLLGANGGKIKNIVDAYILAPGMNIEQEEDAHMILAHVITRYMREIVRSYAEALTRVETQSPSHFRSNVS